MTEPNKPQATNSLTKEQVYAELSKRGNFKWLLEADQVQIFEFILSIGSNRSLVLHISRRYGKSFILTLIAFAVCLGNDLLCKLLGVPRQGAQIIYLAETQTQIQNIFEPNISIILRYLPANLMPKWSQKRNGYVFPTTKSIIRIAGTDNKNYEKLRGGETHLALLDEAAFHDDLQYIYKSIILPQTMRAKGKTIFVSTSPRTPSHPFFEIAQDHIQKNRYMKLTIDDKTTLSEESKRELIEEMGGINSSDVRRELYCEWVTDLNDMVFPECSEDFMKEIVVDEVDLPERFDWYAGMDPGSVDYTGYLVGYYDFFRAKLVIVDEIFEQHEDTDVLADKIAKVEGKWFGSKPPAQRVCDHNLTLISDLARLHRLVFSPVKKRYTKSEGKELMVNPARILLKKGQIEIRKNCKHFIRQLKTGIWTKSRRAFERMDNEGHFDLLDAFIYMCTIVQMNKNPYSGIDKSFLTGDYVTAPSEPNSDAEKLKKAFNL